MPHRGVPSLTSTRHRDGNYVKHQLSKIIKGSHPEAHRWPPSSKGDPVVIGGTHQSRRASRAAEPR